MRLAPCGARIARRVGPRSPAIQVILFPVPEAHDQEASGGSCSQVASARTTTPAANGVAHQQRDAAAGTPLSCDTARSRDRLRPASSPPLPLSRAAPQKSPHWLPSPASARSAVAINSLRMRAARRRAFAHRSSVCVSIFLKASLRVLLRSRLRGLLWRFFPTVPLLFEPLRSPVCDAWARGITMRTHASRRDGARGISPLPAHVTSALPRGEERCAPSRAGF